MILSSNGNVSCNDHLLASTRDERLYKLAMEWFSSSIFGSFNCLLQICNCENIECMFMFGLTTSLSESWDFHKNYTLKCQQNHDATVFLTNSSWFKKCSITYS